MAVMLNEWAKKFPEVDEETLIDWISDMTLRGVEPNQQEAYMLRRSKGEYPSDDSLQTTEETTEPADDEDLEEPADDEDDDEEPADEPEETENPNAFKQAVKQHKEPRRHASNEPPIPFDNPDLSDLEVPEDDDEDYEEEPEYTPPKREKTAFRREEMVTKTITISDYETIIKPFKPFLEDIKQDSATLNKLAASIDSRNMPPYMQIKSYIINHPLKDPNNTQVLLSMVSEANAKNIEQKYIQLTQGVDVTRTLAEQAWFQAALNNYDAIIEKMSEERRAMVSLIYILENYCELKQTSPFELSIPKGVLMESVENSFQNLKELITQNVIKEMSSLRGDLKGQLGDMGSIVEKNMGRFDTQIQEAVTKVMWKVKTDVENTNLEDIKQSLLFLLNKRSASYNLGGGATAIMSIMLDDLERRLLETGFKLDAVGNYRRYTIEELTRKLGYKKATVLIRAIPPLMKRKLITMYQNKTISL